METPAIKQDNFYNCTLAQLAESLAAQGENPAKAALIFRRVYQDGQSDLSALSGLKAALCRDLAARYTLALPQIRQRLDGPGASKYLFALADGHQVEGVLMRHRYGAALCLSTQVGCAMGCAFCQSGRAGKQRDLSAAEMVGQVLAVQRDQGQRPSRLTLMGIGEPLDNYAAVADLLDIVSAACGLAYGPRHITVSTCGLLPGLRELAARPRPVNLCVSLHAPDDELRSRLMPINRVYGLTALLEAVREYSARTGRRVVFEYTLLSGVNDSIDCARRLAARLAGLHCSVNLIPYNQTAAGFTPSPREQVLAFYDALKQAGVTATIRKELGAGLSAACGQLRAAAEKETLSAPN